MRQFAQKGFRIEKLSLEAKVLYSCFCVLALAALAVSMIYYYALVGSTFSRGVAAYYAGAELPAETAETGESTGPALELDDEVGESPQAKAPMVVAATSRKLLEVTHFHLFTVPVFLLIIGHLFMLCRARPALKLAILGGGAASTVLHLAAPWLVHWGGPALAWAMPVSGAAMGSSMLLMSTWPLVAMWRKPPARVRPGT